MSEVRILPGAPKVIKMTLELNSDKQPYVKIAEPKFDLAYEFNREFDLTDLILFTKGLIVISKN